MKTFIKKLFHRSSPYQSLNEITISSQNIIHNISVLQALSGHTIIPVLKSNAYGHGIHQISQIIQKQTTKYDCPLIAVDSYPEYQIVRDTTDRDILVLGEQLPQNYRLYNPKRTHFAVWSTFALKHLADTPMSYKIHLFVNTGMNREGIQLSDIPTVSHIIRSSSTLNIVGMMSHFANADEKDTSYNHTQTKYFHSFYSRLVSDHPALTDSLQYIHINNSAGIPKNMDSLFTCSRAGLAFYGYNPLAIDDPHYDVYEQLSPALRLTSSITSIQDINTGDSVSYGQKWTATKPTTIATIPLGYHEGLPRDLSGADYLIRHQNSYYPILGTICMNIAIIEGSSRMKLFDPIEIISPDKNARNTIQYLSKQADKIPYEILTGLDSSIKRIIQ